MKAIRLNILVLMAIMVCGFALYFVPLQSGNFYFDDHYSVQGNDFIKKIDIPDIFNAFNTRFLPGLSFALNYKFCGLHPEGYRLINLLIHCFNAFLVYLLIKSTLYLYPANKPMFFCRLEWPAFFASMLFLCHPIQTEPVNFITQRFVLMGTFFYLLTLILYIQYRGRSQKKYLIAAVFSGIAAMFCKEFVVTLPLMLTLYEFYFLPHENIWKRCRRLLPFFIIVLIVPLLLLRTPPQAVDVANIAESHTDITRARFAVDRKQYFLTELNVVCTYVRLLFLPIDQNVDYDYPISYSLDKKTALCGIFLFCLLVLAAVMYRSYRFISFSILWFFIALSVESSFIPIGRVIEEYRVYLASVGFVFLVMSLIYKWRVDVKKLNIIAAIILIGFSILTNQRNKVWKNDLVLWSDIVKKSPHKAGPYDSLGNAYQDQGDLAQAIVYFDKGLEVDPYNPVLYVSRGFAYVQQGDFTDAINDDNRAIAIDPDFAHAYYNRGNVYKQLGKYTQALADFNKAIALKPYQRGYYNDRGTVYSQLGSLTQALSDYDKAIEMDPDFAEAYNNRGNTYKQQGNPARALSDFNRAIEINPKYAFAYANRGNTHAMQGDLTDAIADLNKAIGLRPDFKGFYNDRALLYAREKDHD